MAPSPTSERSEPSRHSRPSTSPPGESPESSPLLPQSSSHPKQPLERATHHVAFLRDDPSCAFKLGYLAHLKAHDALLSFFIYEVLPLLQLEIFEPF